MCGISPKSGRLFDELKELDKSKEKEACKQLILEILNDYHSLVKHPEYKASDGSEACILIDIYQNYRNLAWEKIINTFILIAQTCPHFYTDFFQNVSGYTVKILENSSKQQEKYFLDKLEKSDNCYLLAFGWEGTFHTKNKRSKKFGELFSKFCEEHLKGGRDYRTSDYSHVLSKIKKFDNFS